MTPAELLKTNRKIVDSSLRKWSVTKGEKMAGVEAIVWTCTVADVRLDDPEEYCADVRLWANSVIADTEDFIQKLLGDP